MKKTFLILITLLLAALTVSIHSNVRLYNYINTYADTLIVRDTTPYLLPVPVPVPYDSLVLKYKYISIPINPDIQTDSTDIQVVESDTNSIKITIPITQHRYEGKDYTAWISGYEATLDSLWVFSNITTITKPSVNVSKWKIDAYTGVLLVDKHIKPYVNIGISTYTKNRKYEISVAAGILAEGNAIFPCWNLSVKKNLFRW